MEDNKIPAEYSHLLSEITTRIRSAQYEALKAVNREMIALYWEIGKQITEQQTTHGWGKSVVQNLSQDIQKEFPGIKGFGVSNMWDMARFYAEYQSNEILQPLVGEISWSKHIVILTKCKETQQRQFYILATRKFGWTKDVLINKIEQNAYEKYLLGQNNFDKTLPETIRNQAVLALKDEYSLNVLNDTVKLPHENPTIGIIICKSKKRTTVEYALKSSNLPIGVATYSLSSQLPEDYKKLLPEPEDIAGKLEALTLK